MKTHMPFLLCLDYDICYFLCHSSVRIPRGWLSSNGSYDCQNAWEKTLKIWVATCLHHAPLKDNVLAYRWAYYHIHVTDKYHAIVWEWGIKGRIKWSNETIDNWYPIMPSLSHSSIGYWRKHVFVLMQLTKWWYSDKSNDAWYWNAFLIKVIGFRHSIYISALLYFKWGCFLTEQNSPVSQIPVCIAVSGSDE